MHNSISQKRITLAKEGLGLDLVCSDACEWAVTELDAAKRLIFCAMIYYILAIIAALDTTFSPICLSDVIYIIQSIVYSLMLPS